MTASLKTHLAKLARALNLNEATLYERQRALVREGMLESLPGQGRGSGVRATPENLALVIVSFLSSIHLADSALLTKEIARAKPKGGKCPLTGSTTFRDAMAKVLSDAALLAKVRRIAVTGLRGIAEINYGRNQVSRFEGRASEKLGPRFTVSLNFDEMPGIDEAISDMFEEPK